MSTEDCPFAIVAGLAESVAVPEGGGVVVLFTVTVIVDAVPLFPAVSRAVAVKV